MPIHKDVAMTRTPKIGTLILVIAWFASSSASELFATTWPQFGGPNRNFQVTRSSAPQSFDSEPRLRWKVSLGEGLSSLVADESVLYAMYLAPSNDNKSEQQELVAAIDRVTGEIVWRREYACGWIEEQEAFGGRARCPQATPAILGDNLITVGFTGIVHCWDRESGAVKWKRNMIENYDAVPVHFGFSSSPMVHKGKVYLLTGGKQGGLVCLDGESGEVQWNVPCGEASYATPTVLEMAGGNHVVFVTRDRILGVSADKGEILWTYQLPYQGLTNVPTPLVMGDGQLVASGQGVGGTVRLSINHVNGEWAVDESWRCNTQFFYCNWYMQDDIVIGCNDKLLVALDASSGDRVGRWRGYENSNLVVSGKRVVILDGEGQLTVLRRDAQGLEALSKYQVLKQRCWTPPTLVDRDLYCRGGSEIACVHWHDSAAGEELPRREMRERSLAFRRTDRNSSPAEAVDPVAQITTTYEDGGVDAAWKSYEKLRAGGSGVLSHENRVKIAELALAEGLVGFAEQIKEHTLKDFPDARAKNDILLQLFMEKSPRPKAETHLGENGLLYVQLAVRNTGHTALHTQVKGPARHPFGYGIPFPQGKLRIEKWPVGTRLFTSHNGVQGKLLFTVKKSDAGKILEITPSEKH